MTRQVLAVLMLCSAITGCATTSSNLGNSQVPGRGPVNTKAEQLAWTSNECAALFAALQGVVTVRKDTKLPPAEKLATVVASFAEMSIGLVGIDRTKEMVKIATAAELKRFQTLASDQGKSYLDHMTNKSNECLAAAKEIRAHMGLKPLEQPVRNPNVS